ncbi:hypothetical protein N0V88_004419 [Collariella sp. IMI 366227]|nr:hypothetical protein N0V88_004419 [Collariella sp. IMI 366227]
MAINEQTLPELQPIFTLLNSHSNKLYQEGYFLKLDDQDIRGRPNPDRTWTECFAQLVGTVLSLWDAAELDAAGEDGEVLPKFINLTDASIKMIESLPTKTNDEQPLQNILSISTAGRNRYLLHFNSHHSLVQWTSGIRLAMFEHSTLQEAYTGALVAGKGKALNSINVIMERAKQPIQEWVRVRFGAGVPWRRCYCVIEPPSEKEYQKAQKDHKKRSPYDRSHGPILKGEIRFFDTKKEAEKKKKHQRPIASITDAYSAYAIYPQAKELIESSTLLKIEGDITIHSAPPSSTEGFFLFPTWDTFGLYGRPGRLVASALDTRSLMFAMPKHKRYGYLEVLDVSGLISTDGSPSWTERDWRKKLKELTGQRMAAMDDGMGDQSRSQSRSHSRSTSRHSKRFSFGGGRSVSRPRVGFADDSGSVRSSRSISLSRPGMRNDSAPPDHNRERAPSAMAGHSRHSRNISDTQIVDPPQSFHLDNPPPMMRGPERIKAYASDLASTPERISSEDDSPLRGPMAGNLDEMQRMRRMETPEPVNAPPAFAHNASSVPQQKPNPSPEMRRATNRLSHNTLSQLVTAGGLTPDVLSHEARDPHFQTGSPDRPRAGVLKVIGDDGTSSKSGSEKDYGIPKINFGPTFNYSAAALPVDKASSKGSSGRIPNPVSGRKSPGPGAGLTHFRQESDDTARRSIAWQPPAMGPPATENGVSVQQFLQQRAAPTPLYAHQRTSSSNTLTEARPSHSRHSSADLLASGRPLGQSHSRHSSADLLSSGRPASQGTGAMLGGEDSYKRPNTRSGMHSRSPSSADLLASSGRPAPRQAVAQAIDQRQRELNQQAQRAAQVAYAQQQQQQQFVVQQQQAVRPQTPGGMSMMMGGPAPSQYGGQPRPQTPGAMSMMMDGGGGSPSLYNPQPQPRPQTPGSMMGGMNNPRSMSPGPGMMMMPGYGQAQSTQQQQQQQWPQMHGGTYSSGGGGGGGMSMPQGFRTWRIARGRRR